MQQTEAPGESFALAPMSPLVKTLTAFLLALPIVMIAISLYRLQVLVIPAVGMIIVYAWVWLRFRPSRFVVYRRGLKAVLPLKVFEIPEAQVAEAKVVDREALKKEIGWGMRVGAGGLWGGFGLLRTQRRGYVRMFVSRTDRFVWIEVIGGKSWLITPARPEEFVRALLR